MNRVTYIVKSDGRRHSELYIHDKLLKSITAACLSVRAPVGQAENTAQIVCTAVEKWLETHPEVTSRDIRIITARHLNKYQPEAAYLYQQQHVTI